MQALKRFQSFGDHTRLRILNLLADGPLCVGHLVDILGLSQPKISRHLKLLRDAGAVESVRHYHWIAYQVSSRADTLLAENLQILRRIRDSEPELARDTSARDALIARISVPGVLPEPIRLLLANRSPSAPRSVVSTNDPPAGPVEDFPL